MDSAHGYNITIRYGNYEGEDCYEARVKELPDIAEYGDSAEEAYALAIDSIEVTAEVLAEKGKTMPAPQVIPDDYSGRVTLRLPKSLHRALAQASEDEGVSLNQYMTSVLTYYSGFAARAPQERPASAWTLYTQEIRQSKVKPEKRSSSHLQVVGRSEFNQPIEWQKTG